MKIGTLTQIATLSGDIVKIFDFSKNKDGGGSHLEKSQKLRYHSIGLAHL